jgi:hypothetical protein
VLEDRGQLLHRENAWRGLLTGERNIMPPTPPRSEFVRQAAQRPQASFWKEGQDGSMRSVAANESLWSRR